jgi:glycosyltransferase involved in cell wall biosynthesis
MKVGYVTTWRTECGIATYTEELIEAARGDACFKPYVLAPVSIQNAWNSNTNFSVLPCWYNAASVPSAESIANAVEQLDLDIVHYQHEYGLWPNTSAFLDTLKTVAARREEKTRQVVTLHTVFNYGQDAHAWWYDELGKYATVIVHTMAGLGSVACLHSAPGNAVVRIPHGTRRILNNAPDAREQGRQLLNLEQWPDVSCWGISLGFIGHGKNILATLRALLQGYAQDRLRGVGFIVTGVIKDPHYGYTLSSFVNSTGMDRYVCLADHFWTPEEIPKIAAAADFGVLNTCSTALSASGQVHLYASCGLPLIAANRPIYVDALSAGALPFEVDTLRQEEPHISLLNAMAAMARDASLRNSIRDKMRRLAKNSDWSLIAQRHAEVYKAISTTKENA